MPVPPSFAYRQNKKSHRAGSMASKKKKSHGAIHHPWLLIRREENLWEASNEKVVIIEIKYSLHNPSYGLS
jgi:hypothetical protein